MFFNKAYLLNWNWEEWEEEEADKEEKEEEEEKEEDANEEASGGVQLRPRVGSCDPQRWNQLKLRMKSEGWNLSNTAYNMHYIKSRMKCRKDVTMGYDGLWLDQAVMKNLNHFVKKNLIFESILWWNGRLEALDEELSWS